MTAPKAGTILIISDIHAHYHVVDAQVAHAEGTLGRRVDQVLVLGDFGLFAPNLHEFFRRAGKNFQKPVSFIEGNHEDFREFDRLVLEYADVVTYLPRNSRHGFGGHRWLCIGGARYMDAWSTPPGCEISDHDVATCLENEPGSIDLVISHDCPTGIGVVNEAELEHLGAPGSESLAQIAAHLRPRYWFFGHHHRWHESERDGVQFLGLPQSWEGYALLDDRCDLQRVEHLVELPRRPSWLRWIGLK